MSEDQISRIFRWNICPEGDGLGYFVTLRPDGIQLANPTDEIFGVTQPPSSSGVWTRVGLCGIIPVRDDGTCMPGQKCTVGEGSIATAGDRWIVIQRRLGHVEILLK